MLTAVLVINSLCLMSVIAILARGIKSKSTDETDELVKMGVDFGHGSDRSMVQISKAGRVLFSEEIEADPKMSFISQKAVKAEYAEKIQRLNAAFKLAGIKVAARFTELSEIASYPWSRKEKTEAAPDDGMLKHDAVITYPKPLDDVLDEKRNLDLTKILDEDISVLKGNQALEVAQDKPKITMHYYCNQEDVSEIKATADIVKGENAIIHERKDIEPGKWFCSKFALSVEEIAAKMVEEKGAIIKKMENNEDFDDFNPIEIKP